MNRYSMQHAKTPTFSGHLMNRYYLIASDVRVQYMWYHHVWCIPRPNGRVSPSQKKGDILIQDARFARSPQRAFMGTTHRMNLRNCHTICTFHPTRKRQKRSNLSQSKKICVSNPTKIYSKYSNESLFYLLGPIHPYASHGAGICTPTFALVQNHLVLQVNIPAPQGGAPQ